MKKDVLDQIRDHDENFLMGNSWMGERGGGEEGTKKFSYIYIYEIYI